MIPRFRAWDPYEEKMIDDKELVIWGGNIYRGDRDEIFQKIIKGKKGLIGYSFDDEYLMQSTGLKDKNGVEIFEGDVVETEWFKDYEDFSGYRKRGEVVFREGYFGIRYPKDSKRYPYHMLVAAIDIENIGNIYQNPELLESVEE